MLAMTDGTMFCKLLQGNILTDLGPVPALDLLKSVNQSELGYRQTISVTSFLRMLPNGSLLTMASYGLTYLGLRWALIYENVFFQGNQF